MICKIAPYGAFIQFPDGKKGLVHISQIAHAYIKNISDHVKLGQVVKAEVVKIFDDGRIELSIKKTQPASKQKEQPKKPPRPQRKQPEKPEITTSGFKVNPFEEQLGDFMVK